MKITVVTRKGGKIIGTALHAPGGDPAIGQGSPVAGQGGPVAGPGQSVHVIDLPRELEQMEDAEELHRRLKPYLPKRKGKGS